LKRLESHGGLGDPNSQEDTGINGGNGGPNQGDGGLNGGGAPSTNDMGLGGGMLGGGGMLMPGPSTPDRGLH
jgi:hypothetical protein